MLLVELMVPKGAFTPEERRTLAGRLTADRLLAGSGGEHRADPGVLAWFGSLTDVIVHEPDVWLTGGRDLPCLVRIHAGAWAREMSEHLVARATRELLEAAAEFDGPERAMRVTVNVHPVPEGGYGLGGRVLRTADFQAAIEDAKTGTAQLPEGMVVDPACGAVIPADSPVTAELDGEVHRFCCTHCRGSFVKRHRLNATS